MVQLVDNDVFRYMQGLMGTAQHARFSQKVEKPMVKGRLWLHAWRHYSTYIYGGPKGAIEAEP